MSVTSRVVPFGTTSRVPRQVVPHSSRAPTLDATFVAQLFEARDESGTTWRGTLLVVPNGTTRDVPLMMSRPDIR